MRRWTHTIDGIRCPACAHPAQRVTFEAVYARAKKLAVTHRVQSPQHRDEVEA